MKKLMKLGLSLAVIALFALCFMGCPDDGGGSSGPEKWTITWNAKGGTVSPATTQVIKGERLKAEQIKDPTSFPSGMKTFLGWYTVDAATGGSKVSTTTTISGNVTYYARYTADETITISVDVNTPDFYKDTAIDAIAPFSIVKGTAIGSSLPSAPVAGGSAITTMVFLGWFKNASGTGTEVTADTTFDDDATLFASWEEMDEDDFILVFDLNYIGANPQTFQVKATIGVALGDKWPADPTRTDGPNGVATDFTFLGWFHEDNGNGTKYDKTSINLNASKEVSGMHTIYGKWQKNFLEEETVPEGKIVNGDLTEKVTFTNGAFVLYQFVIPNDKTYADYNGIWADMMFSPNNLKVDRTPRTTRVVGSYTINGPSDLQVVNKPTPEAKWGLDSMAIIPIGSYAGISDHNGPYIIASIDGTNQPGAGAGANMESWLDGKGMNSEGWAWNTMKYPHGAIPRPGSGNGAAGPVGTEKGLMIFGLGFGGTADPLTSYIRNVRMIGKESTTDDIVGKPLYFKIGEKVYPSFMGYASTTGSDGVSENYRGMQDGTDPATFAIDITPASAKLTLNSNYGASEEEPVVRSVLSGVAFDADDVAVPGDWTAPGGKVFEKWATQADGGGTTIGVGSSIAGDTEVYAIWSVQYTVNFDPNYASTPAVPKKTFGSFAASDLVSPGRTGDYIFTGWYTDATNGDKITTATVFNGSVSTVYAHWVPFTPAVADYEMLTTAQTPIINSVMFTKAYDSSNDLTFKIAFPTDMSIESYSKYTITAKFYGETDGAKGEEIAVANSLGQVVMTKNTSDWYNARYTTVNVYNLGTAATIQANIPADLKDGNFDGFAIQNSALAVKFIEITSIIFHK